MSGLKIGVIGVGHLGRFHTQNYAKISSADLTGVYDVDQERSKQVAEEYGTKSYSDMQQLLQDIDAVSLVVPTSLHFETAKTILENGIHCLIEKPITSTIEEADALIELARKNNLIIQIGHIERFNPAILALRDIKLNPLFVESHRLASFDPRGTDVAVVLDLMIHDIDIILNLVNSKVKTIDASGVSVLTREVDIANARIQFENGAVANVTASRISQKKMRKMRLFQQDTYIGIDFLEKISEIYRLVNAEATDNAIFGIPIDIGDPEKKKKIIYQKPNVEEVNALKEELISFIDCVQNSRQPIVSGEDGREALRVAIEITNLIEKQLQTYGI
ncbi:MAG: Gfo/Idh/MocA family oxidoreductase [candidate division KSB1 bacterium]|nr:Gfo/Idh/MocA family oxidoreductase [candidate division KSB1 bacterium]